MVSFAQKYRQEGRLEDKFDVLTRLLEKRFGALPKAVRAQIVAAPAEQLDTWIDAVLTAESLQEVFGT